MFVELCLNVSHRALQNAVLSHEEKPSSKNLSQEEKVHCQLPHAASAAASVTKQSFPEETLLGELLPLERLLPSSSQQAEYMGNIQKVVGICCSSAWCQQRQKSDDRLFLDEESGLSSNAPSSLKHIWTNPRRYRSRRRTFPYPLILMLFCYTKCMSRSKGRMGELTQKKSCQKKLSNQSSKN